MGNILLCTSELICLNKYDSDSTKLRALFSSVSRSMADINKWTFHSLQTTVCSADQWSTDFDCSSADHTYSGSLIRPWIRKKLVPMKPKYFTEKKDICPSHVRSVPDKLVHKTCWKLTSICISLLWFLHFVFFNFFFNFVDFFFLNFFSDFG